MDTSETIGAMGSSMDADFSLPLSEPLFWELLLVLFLLSLKFWRVKRSVFFIGFLAVLVPTIPLWWRPLSEKLVASGIVFNAELMRIGAVVIIALVFYLYITTSK
ncbi:MAG: hypothetical protein MJA29_10230 [Candidatus Omnitrophica bacterium]|nr:hypothetical protein [Candidatus Omnitrophota bacterium]